MFTDEDGKSYLGKVQAEAKLGGGVPFFAKLMASVTSSFQAESKHRQSVKSTLRKFPGTLVELVNGLLDETNKVLAAHDRQLLLIVDNFDRYDPRVIDALMVQGADQFKSLRCHITVTPPIGLVLKPESQTIEAVFRCETMPTMKLRNKDQGYGEFSGPGRDRLLEALGKRIDLDRLMPDPMARDRLIVASGGAIRELLEITQDVTLRADGETMTLADVDAVLSRRRNRLRDRIDANGWWDIITQIGRTKRLGPDKGFLEVLFQRLAFQYNGEVWYDVHPLIADLPEYAARVNVVQTP